MKKRFAKIWSLRINAGLRFLIAVLLFGLTVEVCARIDDKLKYGAPILEAYGPERLRTTDSVGIRHNAPNSRFEKWRINQHGFRGPDISIRKRESVKRIVCMGTSETFGLYENPGREWPAQLQGILKEKGSYEIINASVVGLSLEHYLPYLQKYVFKFQPDVLIILINPFTYVQQALSDKEVQSKAFVTYQALKTEAFQSATVFLQSPRMFSKIKQSFKKILPQGILKAFQVWNLSKQVSLIERKRLNGKSPAATISSEILDSFRNDLERIVVRIAANNIKIVLGSYPSLISEENIDQYSDVFLDYRRFCITLSYQGMIDASAKINSTIRELAKERRIPFVDIEKAVPKEKKYFGDNVHFTDEGARLVASFFADRIIQRNDGTLSDM